MTQKSDGKKLLVELDGGRKVVIKVPLVSHSELAAQRGGAEGDIQKNPGHYGMVVQRELLKLCLVKVDGQDNVKKPIDQLFNLAEFNELVKILGELGGQSGKRKAPSVTFL